MVVSRCINSMNNRAPHNLLSQIHMGIISENSNLVHGVLLILKELLTVNDIDLTVLIKPVLTTFPTMVLAARAILIQIASQLDSNEISQMVIDDILKVSNENTCTNLAHYEYFQAATHFAIKHHHQGILKTLLTGVPNAVRAACIELSHLNMVDLSSEFMPILMNIMLNSLCDETRVGAISLLLSSNINLTSEIDATLREQFVSAISEINLQSVSNAALVGMMLEFAVKHDLPIESIGEILLKSSFPHQHYDLRKCAANCCAKQITNGTDDTNIWHAAIILLNDEDHDIRLALENIFGNVMFDSNDKCAIIDYYYQIIRSNENHEECVTMLLEVGFLNMKRKLKLFNIEDRETAFELVNLNLNHEPILLTRIALYGINLILSQVSVYMCIIIIPLLIFI